MISFRRAKSLQDFLVRAVVRSPEGGVGECGGCGGRSDCAVCKVLRKDTKFSNKDKSRTYDIRKGKLDCNSTMCIYLMSCNF